MAPDVCSNCGASWSGSKCEVPRCFGFAANDTRVCSGRGTCVAPDVCSNCGTSWSGSMCEVPKCFGKAANDTSVCSSRGVCVAPDVCSGCAAGYGGSQCQFPICYGIMSNNTNTCSGRGTCDAPDVCSNCLAGYGGSRCHLPICYGYTANDTSRVCSGRGSCVAPDVCVNCNAGWSGSQCQHAICFGLQANNTNVCTGHGTCNLPNNCTCAAGYEGNQCQYPICNGKGSTNPTVCSAHGTCSSPNNCTCFNNWVGIDCETPVCFGRNASDPLVCTGRNGNCTNPNTCTCNPSIWSGNQCQLPVCFGKASNQPDVCSSAGICSNPGNCSCNPLYIGNNCQFRICYGKNSSDPEVCQGHGSCGRPDNCTCDQGWIGNDCKHFSCFGKNSSDASACSSQGNCTAVDTCQCNSEYDGPNCQFPICFGISASSPAVCSGQGDCLSPNNCTCYFANFYGVNCESNVFQWKHAKDGNWTDLSNWDIIVAGIRGNATRLPAAGDAVHLNHPGTYTVFMDAIQGDFTTVMVGNDSSCNPKLFLLQNVTILTLTIKENATLVFGTQGLQLTLGSGVFEGLTTMSPRSTMSFRLHSLITGRVIHDGSNSITFTGSVTLNTITVITIPVWTFQGETIVTGSTFMSVNQKYVFSKGLFLFGSSRFTSLASVSFLDVFKSNTTILVRFNQDVTFNTTDLVVSSNINFMCNVNLNSGSFSLLGTSEMTGNQIYIGDGVVLSNSGTLKVNASSGIVGNGKVQNLMTMNFFGSTKYTVQIVNMGVMVFYGGAHEILSFSSTTQTVSVVAGASMFVTTPVSLSGMLGRGTLHAINLTIPQANWVWECDIRVEQYLVVENDTTFGGSLQLDDGSVATVNGVMTLNSASNINGRLDGVGRLNVAIGRTTFGSTSHQVVNIPILFGSSTSFSGKSIHFFDTVTFTSTSLIEIHCQAFFEKSVEIKTNRVTGSDVGEISIQPSGSMTITNDVNVEVNFTSYGDLTVNSGVLSFTKESRFYSKPIVINPNAVLAITKGQVFQIDVTGNGMLRSDGYIEFPDASTTQTVSCDVSIFGKLSVLAGTLTLNGVVNSESKSSLIMQGTSQVLIQNRLNLKDGSTIGPGLATVNGNLHASGSSESVASMDLHGALEVDGTFSIKNTFIASLLSTVQIQGRMRIGFDSQILSRSVLGSGSINVIQGVLTMKDIASRIDPVLMCGGGVVSSPTTIKFENVKAAIANRMSVGPEGSLNLDTFTALDLENGMQVQGGTVFGSGRINVVAGELVLNQGTIEVNTIQTQKNSRFIIGGGGAKSIKNTIVDVLGGFTMQSSQNLNMISTNVTLSSGTTSLFENSEVSLDSESSIVNFGAAMFNSSKGDVLMNGAFQNAGIMNIAGSGITRVSSGFTQKPYSTLSLFQSRFGSIDTLSISNGNVNADGIMEAPDISVTSNTGVFKLGQFKVVGNLTISESVTVIIQLRGTKKGDYGTVNVDGSLSFTGLVFIKLESEFKPIPEMEFEVFSYGTVGKVEGIVNLIGVPYMSAKYVSSELMTALKIVVSIGVAGDRGYRCHYIGHRRILEIVKFEEQQQISLTLTTPIVAGWVAFGFDTANRSLSSALLVLTSEKQNYQIFGHNDSYSQSYVSILDVGSSTGVSIFNIGPEYQSISMFLPQRLFETQNVVFYAENTIDTMNSSQWGKHTFAETIEYSVLTGPEGTCTNFNLPSQNTVYSIPALSIVLIIYAITFILCVIFMKFQPLNSRGISPLLTLGFLFSQLLMEIRNLFFITEFQASLCFYLSYGYYPMQQLCFIMILLYFIRYFAIINLNGNKNVLARSNGAVSKFQKTKMKILKFFTSTKLTVVLVVVSYLVCVAIYTIALIPNGFVCKFDNLTAIKIINNVLLILIYVITIATGLVDMMNNLKLIVKCQLKQYIIKGDPYYFRVQILLFIPFMVYSLCIELYHLFSSVDYVGVIVNYPKYLIFNTISCAILYIIEVLFPLVMTWITLLQRKCRKQKNKQTVEYIMKDPELNQLFREFCASEYSVENFAAFVDIQDWKKTRNPGADVIFEKYLNGNDSIMEVNCSANDRRDVKAKIDGDAPLQNDVFKGVEKVLYTNLADTHSRFQFWGKYNQYMENIRLNKELIEGTRPTTVNDTFVNDRKLLKSFFRKKNQGTKLKTVSLSNLKDVVSDKEHPVISVKQGNIGSPEIDNKIEESKALSDMQSPVDSNEIASPHMEVKVQEVLEHEEVTIDQQPRLRNDLSFIAPIGNFSDDLDRSTDDLLVQNGKVEEVPETSPMMSPMNRYVTHGQETPPSLSNEPFLKVNKIVCESPQTGAETGVQELQDEE